MKTRTNIITDDRPFFIKPWGLSGSHNSGIFSRPTNICTMVLFVAYANLGIGDRSETKRKKGNAKERKNEHLKSSERIRKAREKGRQGLEA